MKCDSCKDEFDWCQLTKIKEREVINTNFEDFATKRWTTPFYACPGCFERWNKYKDEGFKTTT